MPANRALSLMRPMLAKPELSTASMHQRAVVTGIGALTPWDVTVGDFWKNLIKGKSGMRAHSDPLVDLYLGIVDLVTGEHLAQLQGQYMDRVSQLGRCSVQVRLWPLPSLNTKNCLFHRAEYSSAR